MNVRSRLTAGLAFALPVLPAAAHPGGATGHDLWAGLIHPISGFDHLLMLVLLGAWLARSGAGWRAGLLMMAGLAAGVLNSGGALPFAVTEGLVMVSLPVAATVAVTGSRGTAVAALLLAAMYCHGQAHLSALGVAATPALALGLALASGAVLVGAGLLAGRLRVPAAGESARSTPTGR